MSNKFKQNLFAAAAVTLWGSAIPVTKMIGASVSPFGMSAVKCLIAAVLLGAAAMAGKARRPSGRRELLLLLAASLSGFSLYMVSSTIGMMTTPASTASIIASLSPIMTAVGAVAFYRQRISAVGWAAIAAAFAGVLVIVLWNGELVIRPGILWLLLSVALFSAYSLLVPLLGGTFTANEIVTYAMIGAAVVLAPFLPQAAGELWAAPAYVRWLMLYMGVFPGCAAYLLWSGAFALAENSGDVANYMYLTPVTSTAAAFFLLGEVPDAGIYIGGAVIILSVVVFSLKGERRREDAAWHPGRTRGGGSALYQGQPRAVQRYSAPGPDRFPSSGRAGKESGSCQTQKHWMVLRCWI